MSMTQRYAGMLRRQAADWDKREMPIQAECCRQAARHMEELQASKDSEIQTLRAALQWYADGLHFDKASPDAWDTVSGEPQNWWCDEAGTATVEDGSIAKMTLAGELTAAQIQALDDDDQAWDRNAERITREVMGADVDRPINPHATSVDDL
jgi:hypothetical protein